MVYGKKVYPANHGAAWTYLECHTLHQMNKRGVRVWDIAKQMGRTRFAIECQLVRMGHDHMPARAVEVAGGNVYGGRWQEEACKHARPVGRHRYAPKGFELVEAGGSAMCSVCGRMVTFTMGGWLRGWGGKLILCTTCTKEDAEEGGWSIGYANPPKPIEKASYRAKCLKKWKRRNAKAFS